ncbi:MAG: hypothetical protein WDM81_08530 [Rhizomicrobium sp.]
MMVCAPFSGEMPATEMATLKSTASQPLLLEPKRVATAAGMQAVGGHAAAFEAPRQLAREQDVHELRGAVGAEGAVALAELKVVEVDPAGAVGHRSGGDDARARRRLQVGQQNIGDDEIGQVVDREGHLQPVDAFLPRGEDRAGIVDQDVDARLGGGDFRRDALHLGDGREVGEMGGVRGRGVGGAELGEGRVGAGRGRARSARCGRPGRRARPPRPRRSPMCRP